MVSLIPLALATCGLLVFSAGAQQTGKATASKTPTIDQSLEWKAAFNPKMSPDGKRVVYEVQQANWEENAFERNLWIVEVATGEAHPLTSAKKSFRPARANNRNTGGQEAIVCDFGRWRRGAAAHQNRK